MTSIRRIAVDDPRDPGVRELLERHLAFSLTQTPPEHSFALDPGELLDPAITLFSFREDGTVLGVGALRQLEPRHGEIKSMHTAEAARGCGVGRAILARLLQAAAGHGLRRVSLETGTTTAFAPARALYASIGFEPCEAFGGHLPSDDNCFMTLELTPHSPPLSGLDRTPAARRRA